MKKSDITYITASVFSVATAFFYCSAMWFGIKLPRYYPTEHVWKCVKEAGVPSQSWYGRQLFAYAAAAVITLAVYLIVKYSALYKKDLQPRFFKILGIVVTAVVVVCMGYMLYYEFDKWGIF